MKTKTLMAVILMLALCIPHVNAATWTTAGFGYWHQNAVWQGGVVPPYSSSDTFMIMHPVAYNADLCFNDSALVIIDSAGGLCGHHKIEVLSGAVILKYGILEADTLYISGGQVYCYPPGIVVLTLHGILEGSGSSFDSYGCSVEVGPWFECLQPAYAFTGVDEEESLVGAVISPNPSNGLFTLTFGNEATVKDGRVALYNMQGRLLQQKEIRETQTQFDLSQYARGIYFLRISNEEKSETIKIIKQ